MKHVKTGMCLNGTRVPWRSLFTNKSVPFLEFSNNCLDPAAQFRFDDGAVVHLKTQGCLYPARYKPDYYYDMLHLYISCSSSSSWNIYRICNSNRAISQTCWGGLRVRYKGYTCAVPKTNKLLRKNQGIDPYVGLTNCCNTEDKHFNFGKFF